ncbi:ribonuclease toxin immunity protein CdiI [Bacillus atrophaeus]|uniref:ribonuclease toxin immunity protein CdiI n=1 Tax=Bacillus atrophaeus TaxID=1452 RepID=UPI00227DA4F5|nr:ribonuclease toxin immunity protein CdiI [Bacillus atrophaeus]MCY9163931.1 ribonuclease toxin immunity protein CdiI [Bacillus atrophaeus]
MDNKNKDLINYFFQVMGDERFLRILEKFSNGEGYGIENVRCVFADDYEEWEEDYFGNEGIAFYFDYPAVEEDEEVILDYENFYQYLNEIVGQYLERHPENKSEVEKYMGTIKEKYNIKL